DDVADVDEPEPVDLLGADHRKRLRRIEAAANDARPRDDHLFLGPAVLSADRRRIRRRDAESAENDTDAATKGALLEHTTLLPMVGVHAVMEGRPWRFGTGEYTTGSLVFARVFRGELRRNGSPAIPAAVLRARQAPGQRTKGRTLASTPDRRYIARMPTRRMLLAVPLSAALWRVLAAQTVSSGGMTLAMHQNTSRSAGFRGSLEGWARAGIRYVELTDVLLDEFLEHDTLSGAGRLLADLGLTPVSAAVVLPDVWIPGPERASSLDVWRRRCEQFAELGL